MTAIVNQEAVQQAYRLLTAPGQVVEIRALEASFDTSRYTATIGGYFDNIEILTREICRLRQAQGIYITLQPCHPDLLHKAKNKLKPQKSADATSDKHITEYRWLLIDSDPERVTGISSSDDEHNQALAHSAFICNELCAIGWPDPVTADSGNGAHLLYRIELTTDETDKNLVKRTLAGLAERYSTDAIKVDTSVFNPARICKLYGTLACKGDNTTERPHRLSRLLEVPADLQIVTREQLEMIATPIPAHQVVTPQPPKRHSTSPEGFTAEQFLAKHHIRVKSSSPYEGGTRYKLDACVWDASHTDNSACVYEGPDGRLGASCSHNSCQGKGWREFRLVFEPDAYSVKSQIPKFKTLESGQEPDVSFVLECLHQAEWGDSLLFAHLFRGRVLYDHSEKEWYLWDTHNWTLDTYGRVKHFVSGQLASVYIRAGATLNIQMSEQEAKILNDDEEEQARAKERLSKLKKQIGSLTERAFLLRQVARNKNVLTFAATHEGMGITADKWDKDPWLLAVPNGIIQLATGKLRAGKPDDYIRTVCPTHWQGVQVRAPRWERFLEEIFEDRPDHVRQEIIIFLKRIFGYGITGEVREHVFLILYGENGRNGKDTIQHALSYALGAVSAAIQKDVLLATDKGKSAGSATPHLMDLQGKRLAWANEPERGARFNIGQIKDLSGGGDIPARGLFEKKITKIKPSHLLVLLTNHKPQADANDAAFWDRLRFITFNMRYVDNPIEPNERKKDATLWSTLESEASGILAWLVQGCLDWQAEGLTIPQSINNDAQDYREEEDIIHLFLSECCIIKQGATVKASKLYDAYVSWAKSSPHTYILNRSLFGNELKKKKLTKITTKYGVIYQNIGLITPDGEHLETTQLEVFTDDETASQADLDLEQSLRGEHREHLNHKVQKNSPHVRENLELTGLGVHGVHPANDGKTVNAPVERIEDRVNTHTEVFTASVNTSKGVHPIETPDEQQKVSTLPTLPTPVQSVEMVRIEI